MRFKKLYIDFYPSAKVGDLVEINKKLFKVVGLTDAGTNLLVQVPGEYEIYKLVSRKEKK